VDKEPTSCPRPGIEVFVTAPDGSVDVPVMELERHVTNGVGEVPDYKDRVRVGEVSDGGNVEELARVVLDSGEENEGGCGCVLGNDGDNLLCGEDGVCE